ncbi:hypothetical protein TPY_2567 [Sulfobacillus acidophilus TPY]|nr:hypothetical protein TPY_2567 [Sulfobacillus acidophilus TPY]
MMRTNSRGEGGDHRMTEPRLTRYVAIAALLGFLALLNHIFLSNAVGFGYIAIVLAAAMLVTAFFAGRAAKLRGGHPGWFGGLIGAIFGLLEGFDAFFSHLSRRDIRLEFGRALSAQKVALLLHMANSPGAHLMAAFVSILTFGLFALIVGSIGGFYVKKPGTPDPV